MVPLMLSLSVSIPIPASLATAIDQLRHLPPSPSRDRSETEAPPLHHNSSHRSTRALQPCPTLLSPPSSSSLAPVHRRHVDQRHRAHQEGEETLAERAHAGSDAAAAASCSCGRGSGMAVSNGGPIGSDRCRASLTAGVVSPPVPSVCLRRSIARFVSRRTAAVCLPSWWASRSRTGRAVCWDRRARHTQADDSSSIFRCEHTHDGQTHTHA